MGERLRLRKDFDVSPFSPEVQAILKGLKKYGMFVADNGIDWAISCARTHAFRSCTMNCARSRARTSKSSSRRQGTVRKSDPLVRGQIPMLTELFETAPVSDESFPPWFASLASALLNTVDFVVNGESHRFAELEAYYHGPGHPDIFAHRDPLQLERGRWYFHRTGGEYRGGSFKGLDLTFGDGSTHFGILIRSIIDPDGKLVGGPSLTVDRILADTGMGDVATLDCAIGTRTVWDASSPLSICTCDSVRTAAVYATSRVGLSLKRSGTRRKRRNTWAGSIDSSRNREAFRKGRSTS